MKWVWVHTLGTNVNTTTAGNCCQYCAFETPIRNWMYISFCLPVFPMFRKGAICSPSSEIWTNARNHICPPVWLKSPWCCAAKRRKTPPLVLKPVLFATNKTGHMFQSLSKLLTLLWWFCFALFNGCTAEDCGGSQRERCVQQSGLHAAHLSGWVSLPLACRLSLQASEQRNCLLQTTWPSSGRQTSTSWSPPKYLSSRSSTSPPCRSTFPSNAPCRGG